MKITLQQCIFLISNLAKKQTRLLNSLNSVYYMPLTVNGKDVSDKIRAAEMKDDLHTMDLITQDLVTLKSALSVANNKHKIGKKTLFAVLEEVRVKRDLLSNYEYALSRNITSVETGVGVVRYGILNEDLLKEKYEALEKEVNRLSEQIDSVNASVEIEVKLLSEEE
ncbi:MAG: hypothetical protein Q4A75_08005 [Peptostreptococcaceae bacterium]|nr:hypothetical protein [Peptostreptococcaceae bacterium]